MADGDAASGPALAGVPRSFAPLDAENIGGTYGAAKTEVEKPSGKSPETTPDKPSEKSGIDGPEVVAPRGGRRVWPAPKPPISAEVRTEALAVGMNPKPIVNSFSSWQMPFSAKLPSGTRCPISMLGECGDPTCASFRPKHPEVRAEIEAAVVTKCINYFEQERSLGTYVSVGCGMLAQDWIVLEKLRVAGLRPHRIIFVELRASHPLLTLEGHSQFCTGRLDLHQTGMDRVFGPEFSFYAEIGFDTLTRSGTIFDFCNGPGNDAIFAEVVGPAAPGHIIFGMFHEEQSKVLTVAGGWKEGEVSGFLFTISGTGTLRVYANGQELGRAEGHLPRAVERRYMYVGGASDNENSDFEGKIMKIKVWDHEVDFQSARALFAGEMSLALEQFVQWHCEDAAVWTFGNLGSYAEAAAADSRFAADLLIRIDVHDDIDGYEDFACKALTSSGLALTLGGPGSSWSRSGGGFRPVTDVKVEVLDKAEAWVRMRPCRSPVVNIPFFDAPDVICHISNVWPPRRRTLALEVRKKKGTRRRRREAAAIEVDADMPDIVAPRKTFLTSPKKAAQRVRPAQEVSAEGCARDAVLPDDSGLNEQGKALMAEAQKRAHYYSHSPSLNKVPRPSVASAQIILDDLDEPHEAIPCLDDLLAELDA